MYVPTDDGTKDNIFVSSSFDPTSHFEGETKQLMDAHRRVLGKDIDLVNLPEETDE